MVTFEYCFQGLVQSKQKDAVKTSSDSLLNQEIATISTSVEQKSEYLSKAEEACPICHENLSKQKMVFQCGHVICCKCNYYTTLAILTITKFPIAAETITIECSAFSLE